MGTAFATTITMLIHTITQTPVGADKSCTTPIMAFNQINGISVGADLSRTIHIKLRMDELMCLSVIFNQMRVGCRSCVLTLTSIHDAPSSDSRISNGFRTVHEQRNRHVLPPVACMSATYADAASPQGKRKGQQPCLVWFQHCPLHARTSSLAPSPQDVQPLALVAGWR